MPGDELWRMIADRAKTRGDTPDGSVCPAWIKMAEAGETVPRAGCYVSPGTRTATVLWQANVSDELKQEAVRRLRPRIEALIHGQEKLPATESSIGLIVVLVQEELLAMSADGCIWRDGDGWWRLR